MSRKLFRNATIFTPVDMGKPLFGEHQGAVRRFEKGALFCENGLVSAIGAEKDVLYFIPPGQVDLEVDCEGAALIPGLVDPHTHMCFTRTREAEFQLRLEGAQYLDILEQGGGILSTVQSVRESSEEELFDATRKRVLTAMSLGSTTIEIKSGYGLDTNTELKMLRVIHRVDLTTPANIVPTFMGAHVVPSQYRENPDEYVEIVVREMIPAVAQQEIARFCDVFCEKGVFSVEQARRVLLSAQRVGLGIKVHADEMNALGGAGLASELKAVSADHLLAASEEDLLQMAKRKIVGVLLPGTAFSLKKEYAPARKMIQLGVPLALATDCNPGSSFTESMPFIQALAVIGMGMSPNEALVAGTLNAAYAVGMQAWAGSLDKGKNADFLLVDGDGPAIFAYHPGVNSVISVYKRAEKIF